MIPRGQRRLQLASGLLQLGDMQPKDVLDFISLMTAEEQDALRSDIDWLEAYEAASKDSLPRSATNA